MSEEQLPQAYRDGKVDFYGREFLATPDVLIPRPETEQAIDLAKSLAGLSILPGVKASERRLPDKPRILDVGTGSGCIAVTLKLEIPKAEVVAVDVSDAALSVAQKNAERFGAEVKFLRSDLLEKVEGEFDVVVANLPYVDRSWEWLKEPESAGLKYEPELALYAGDGGCALIFELLKQARGRTEYLIIEADPCQHTRIVERAKEAGFNLIKTSGFQLLFGLFGVFGKS